MACLSFDGLCAQRGVGLSCVEHPTLAQPVCVPLLFSIIVLYLVHVF